MRVFTILAQDFGLDHEMVTNIAEDIKRTKVINRCTLRFIKHHLSRTYRWMNSESQTFVYH